MKLPSTFKLSKATKRRLATILDPHLRGVLRRSMAQAEFIANQKAKTSKGKDD
jgi:hypothetical protein